MNNWKCPPNDGRLPKNSLLYRPTDSTLTFIHVNKTTVNICQQKPSHIGHVGAPKHHSLSLSFSCFFFRRQTMPASRKFFKFELQFESRWCPSTFHWMKAVYLTNLRYLSGNLLLIDAVNTAMSNTSDTNPMKTNQSTGCLLGMAYGGFFPDSWRVNAQSMVTIGDSYGTACSSGCHLQHLEPWSSAELLWIVSGRRFSTNNAWNAGDRQSLSLGSLLWVRDHRLHLTRETRNWQNRKPICGDLNSKPNTTIMTYFIQQTNDTKLMIPGL